jgi:hypothetical protein
MARVPTIPDPQRVITNPIDPHLLIQTAGSVTETDYDNTYRPNLKPSQRKGTQFEPFNLPQRESRILNLPSTPLLLFQQFLPISLVEKWVNYTNEGPEPGRQGPPQEHSRKLDWTPASTAEIFLLMSVLIYAGIHRVDDLKDLWKVPAADSFIPEHPIAKVMSRNRFQELFRRLRIFEPIIS